MLAWPDTALKHRAYDTNMRDRKEAGLCPQKPSYVNDYLDLREGLQNEASQFTGLVLNTPLLHSEAALAGTLNKVQIQLEEYMSADSGTFPRKYPHISSMKWRLLLPGAAQKPKTEAQDRQCCVETEPLIKLCESGGFCCQAPPGPA